MAVQRQNPAYRLATETPASAGVSICAAARVSSRRIVSHAATAASTAAGTASAPACPTQQAGEQRRRDEQPRACGHAGGGADGHGERRRDVEPHDGEDRDRDAQEDRREHRAAAEAAPEADRVGQRLGHEQNHARSSSSRLPARSGTPALTGEQHGLRIGSEPGPRSGRSGRPRARRRSAAVPCRSGAVPAGDALRRGERP